MNVTAVIFRRSLILMVTGIVVLATVICIRWSGNTVESQLTGARKALEARNFEDACRIAEQVLAARPGNTRAVLIGARAAEGLNDLPQALSFLELLPARFDDYEVYRGWLKKAELQQRSGHLSKSEGTLRAIIRQVAGEVTARQRLAELLAGCGFSLEATQLLRELLTAGSATRQDLLRLAANGDDLFGQSQLERYLLLNPDDLMTRAGLVAVLRNARKAAAIDELLNVANPAGLTLKRESIRQRLKAGIPGSEFSQSAAPSLTQELVPLLKEQEDDPELLLLAGELARQLQQPEAALRYFARAVHLDRWNLRGLYAVADLTRQQNPNDSRVWQDLTQAIESIQNLARRIRRAPSDAAAVRDLAFKLASIGRRQEANAWARIALSADRHAEWAAEMIQNRHTRTAWTHPVEPLLQKIVSDWNPADSLQQLASLGRAVENHSELRFDDVASRVGLTFRYDNGRVPGQQGLFMHQWTGGGVGVLDVDGDEWPDLCFSQGGALSGIPVPGRQHDRIFRNLRGTAFADVTEATMTTGSGFGQGVGVADVNNDGFDDVYIGRAGGNVLAINLGDGTFLKAPDISKASAWTTSVALADLNGDSNPDIYDVNYLSGAEVFTSTCDHGGLQRICGPTDFPAERDCLLLSDGKGGWSDVSDTYFNGHPPERGMGLVVGDLLQSGQNQVYVANDEGPNQLYTRDSSDSGSVDVAVWSGVAVNGLGEALGSMGIAIGDVNSDGSADLFVTNYYAETNTLYRQVAGSTFVDGTSEAGLDFPGFAVLGFGCQFADADLDGDQDLFVSNGHLDDFTHLGQPFRMQPQIYENIGTGRFREVAARSGYLAQPWLGRAVARLDWNGDGLVDFVVTHIDEDVALVENHSAAGQSDLTVQIVGTGASRDAVGTTIRLTSHNSAQSQWITAGDGYQCTNERVCRFTISNPSAESVLKIRWPGNRTGIIRPPASVHHLKIIEGRDASYSVPR